MNAARLRRLEASFGRLVELDRVMCELDDLRPGPTLTRAGWAEGMEFQKFLPSRDCGAGAVSGAGSNAPLTAARQAAEGVRAQPVPISAPALGLVPSQPVALCIWCVMERALQPGPRMAPPRFNGDVMLWPCARHDDARPDSSTSTQRAERALDALPHPLPAA